MVKTQLIHQRVVFEVFLFYFLEQFKVADGGMYM